MYMLPHDTAKLVSLYILYTWFWQCGKSCKYRQTKRTPFTLYAWASFNTVLKITK